MIIGARTSGVSLKQARATAHVGARCYRQTLRRFAALSPLERYYLRAEVSEEGLLIDPDS